MKEILQITDAEHVGFDDLVNSITRYDKLIKYLNATKELAEKRELIKNLSKLIDNWEVNIIPLLFFFFHFLYIFN